MTRASATPCTPRTRLRISRANAKPCLARAALDLDVDGRRGPVIEGRGHHAAGAEAQTQIGERRLIVVEGVPQLDGVLLGAELVRSSLSCTRMMASCWPEFSV